MKKRLASILLALVMLLSLLPAAALAGTVENCQENCDHKAAIETTHYDTLADAIAAVPTNGTETTITMIDDEDFGDLTSRDNTGVKIVNGQKIILDLAGHTISGERTNDKSAQIIRNEGALTIMDSSNGESGLIVIHSGNTTDPWAVSSSAISNGRDLTILSGNIESGDLSGSYGIDSLQNGFSYDVNLWIKGGHIESQYRGVRLFTNGTNGSDNLFFTDGIVEGGEAVALWIQNPNSLKNKAKVVISDNATMLNPTGNAFSISGGADNSGFDVSITGGKFYGAVSSPIEGIITGGYYLSVGKWVYDDYLSEPMNIPGGESDLNQWFTTNKDNFFAGNEFTITSYNQLSAAEKMGYGFKFDYYGIWNNEGYWFPYVYVIDKNPAFDTYIADNFERISTPETDPNYVDYPYMVGAENPVAKIGNRTFATLDDAFNAAIDGNTVELLRAQDIGNVTIQKGITLDLGNFEHHVNSMLLGQWNCGDYNITIQNGTIVADSNSTGGTEPSNVLVTLYSNGTTDNKRTFENVTFEFDELQTQQVFSSSQKANLEFIGCTFDVDSCKGNFLYNHGGGVTFKNSTVTMKNMEKAFSASWPSSGIEYNGNHWTASPCNITFDNTTVNADGFGYQVFNKQEINVINNSNISIKNVTDKFINQSVLTVNGAALTFDGSTSFGMQNSGVKVLNGATFTIKNTKFNGMQECDIEIDNATLKLENCGVAAIRGYTNAIPEHEDVVLKNGAKLIVDGTGDEGLTYCDIKMDGKSEMTLKNVDWSALKNSSLDITDAILTIDNIGYIGINNGTANIGKDAKVTISNCGTKKWNDCAYNENTCIKATGAITVAKDAVMTCNGEVVSATDGNIVIKSGKYNKVYTDGGQIILTGGIYKNRPDDAYVAAGYAVVNNTDEATKASYPYKVVPVLTMEGYAYGTNQPSEPVYPTIDGATATVYYSSKTFLDTENTGIKWENIIGTTLVPGNYFMKAVYTKDGVIVAETPQTTFTVTKGTQAAPAAPTVSENVVTVAAEDRGVANKTLEYAIDGTSNWMPVPKLTEAGTFTVSGLAAGSHTVYLRWRENNLYNASAASAGASMSLTQYSVKYNANGGVGTIATQTANTGMSLTVASGSAMSRTGYTFNAWNTEANGTGTAYAVGSTISTGMTLYAQWRQNSCTVSFDANGGTGTAMTAQTFTYDVAQTLTANTYTRSSYTFAGWATRANGPVVYLDEQNVKNLAASGTVTLYAVWTQNTGTVTGTIKTNSAAKMTLELKRGATVIETKEVTPSGGNASVGFAAVPYGTYNLVITQGNVVVTQIIVNSVSTDVGEIKMPDSNVNSLLEVKGEDTQSVVVGNLDKEAESKAEEDKNVFVVMTVEKQEEQELPETATAQEQTTQKAIVKIKETAVTETKDTVTQEVSAAAAAAITEDTVQVEFLNITVEKYVGETTMTMDKLEEATTTETVTETNNVIEIVVPYDMSGKENIIVYRYHDNTATALGKLSEKPTGSFADGKYFLDENNDLIYIYTQKFSTYGISYTEATEQPVSPTGGGGGVTTYTITGADTVNGKLTVDKKTASSGSTVTITVTPDKGFTLETLAVLDKNGKEIEVKNLGENKYSFKMPSGKVTVKATFMEDNSMLNFFVDVKATDYFYDAVLWAAENGITKGTDALHFSPAAPVTRAQAVTFLWRAAGCPKPATELNPFTDVKADAYYYEAVLWAVENGITKGTTDTTFSPDKVCTRAHIVTFLARFAGVEDTDTGYTHGFTDVKTADYFNNAVAWAKENKVTEGTTPTSFSPNHNCTRAQVVTFIYRWMVK